MVVVMVVDSRFSESDGAGGPFILRSDVAKDAMWRALLLSSCGSGKTSVYIGLQH